MEFDKTFQIEALIALVTKTAFVLFLTFVKWPKIPDKKKPKSDFPSQYLTSKIIQIFQKKFC